MPVAAEVFMTFEHLVVIVGHGVPQPGQGSPLKRRERSERAC